MFFIFTMQIFRTVRAILLPVVGIIEPFTDKIYRHMSSPFLQLRYTAMKIVLACIVKVYIILHHTALTLSITNLHFYLTSRGG